MRNNKFKTGTRMSVFVAACLLGVSGCADQRQINFDTGEPGYQNVNVMVPTNYLTGEAWRMGTLSSQESASWFEKKIVLKKGDYDVPGLCREIERTTGKIVAWVPSDAGQTGTRRFRVVTKGHDDSNGCIAIPKNVKIKYLIDAILAFATEVGMCGQLEYAEPPPKDGVIEPVDPDSYVWVAIVTEKRIVFVLLPGKTYDEN